MYVHGIHVIHMVHPFHQNNDKVGEKESSSACAECLQSCSSTNPPVMIGQWLCAARSRNDGGRGLKCTLPRRIFTTSFVPTPCSQYSPDVDADWTAGRITMLRETDEGPGHTTWCTLYGRWPPDTATHDVAMGISSRLRVRSLV